MELIKILLTFIGIWIGAGLAIKPIDKISKRLKKPSFIVSFFVLGLFTSLTEISVAINSYVVDSVEISIGNLLGGSFVLLMFVIPLLGLLSKEVKLNHQFGISGIFFSIVLLLTPHFFFIDRILSKNESIVLLIMYGLLVLSLVFKGNTNSGINHNFFKITKKGSYDLIAGVIFMTLGISLLIYSSNYLVAEIYKLSTLWNLSPFVISLIGLSLSTNLPEISFAIISALKGRAEIGFGNYIGSAVFNIFILSILGIVSGGVLINSNFTNLLIFSVIGFVLFYKFVKSKSKITRKESIILLLLYILFITFEIFLS